MKKRFYDILQQYKHLVHNESLNNYIIKNDLHCLDRGTTAMIFIDVKKENVYKIYNLSELAYYTNCNKLLNDLELQNVLFNNELHIISFLQSFTTLYCIAVQKYYKYTTDYSLLALRCNLFFNTTCFNSSNIIGLSKTFQLRFKQYIVSDIYCRNVTLTDKNELFFYDADITKNETTY